METVWSKRNLLIVMFIEFFMITSLATAEELRILCWEGYAIPEYTDKFQKIVKDQFGVDLKITVKNVSDPQEFFNDARGSKVDLISPANNIPKSDKWGLIQNNIVLPIDLNNISNYKDIIPALQKADYIVDNDLVYGVPIVYGPYGLFYNTQLLKEAPKSAKVFWEPQFAGKYALSEDYHEANIYLTALAFGVNKKDIFNFDKINTPEIKIKVRQLAQNAKNYWVGVDTADALQGLAFATAWGFALPELKKRGEIWKMADLQEGTTGWVDNWMLSSASLKDNPLRKRIAEAWINYSIGQDTQIGYVRNIAQFPVNITIKDRLTPEEISYFHLDDPNYFKDKLILWEVLDRRSQNGYKVIWSQAKEK